MEISKKRIAVKLNSQVEIILAKCQDQISRLSSDFILTQIAPKGGNCSQLQVQCCFGDLNKQLPKINYLVFPSLTYLRHNWRISTINSPLKF
jgi:hypothetical protein